MAKLKTLEIGFENCETISFNADEVASFSINKITQDFYNDWYSDDIREAQKTEDLILILLPDANHVYKKNGFTAKETTFERIKKHKDITDLTLITKAGAIANITTTWSGNREEENQNQSVAVLSDGSLVIVVSAKRTADEVKKKLDEKIRKIDEENEDFKKSFDKNHGRWVKVYGYATAGGDPVYKCSNCGLDEHCYGIEHWEKHEKCKNCGSKNIYPWEGKKNK